MNSNIELTEFIHTIYSDLESNESVCLATPAGEGVFYHYRATDKKMAQIERRPGEWYVCASTVKTQSPLRRRKQDCTAAWVLMLDDIGTKVEPPPLDPSCILETSAGNFQYLYMLEPWDVSNDENRKHFEACNRGLINAGYGDPGSAGVSRVFRVPGSLNNKEGRDKFATRVTLWEPGRIWTLDDLMATLGVDPVHKHTPTPRYDGSAIDIDDPVLTWLASKGRLGEAQDDGWNIVQCPWAHEHTTGTETAGYSPLSQGDEPLTRGFNCFHGHCARRSAHDFLAWVQEQGGPRCDVVGVREFDGAALKRLASPLTTAQRRDLLYSSLPALHKGLLPDLTKMPNGALGKAQAPTKRNVAHIVDTYGVDLRFNMQHRRLECAYRDETLRALGDAIAAKRTVIDGCYNLGISNRAEVQELMTELGEENRYHPMEEWIRSVEWDGKSRFKKLCKTVTPAEDYEKMWPVYLRRWLIQGVQAVRGWREPEQISGVLVLAGPQGCFKTSWLASLVPKQFFAEGVQLDLKGVGHKDAIMRGTSTPMVELGELEVTFKKAEAGALKAFLSSSEDAYRPPYGREVVHFPRMTSYSGSVNRNDFLIDETGSRRFWPVRVSACESRHGMDIQQVWAEANRWWESGEIWWLEDDEDAERATQAEVFRALDPVEEEFRQHLHLYGHKLTSDHMPMNLTMVADHLGLPKDRRSLSLLRYELDTHIGPRARQIGKIQNAWLFPPKGTASLAAVAELAKGKKR